MLLEVRHERCRRVCADAVAVLGERELDHGCRDARLPGPALCHPRVFSQPTVRQQWYGCVFQLNHPWHIKVSTVWGGGGQLEHAGNFEGGRGTGTYPFGQYRGGSRDARGRVWVGACVRFMLSENAARLSTSPSTVRGWLRAGVSAPVTLVSWRRLSRRTLHTFRNQCWGFASTQVCAA